MEKNDPDSWERPPNVGSKGGKLVSVKKVGRREDVRFSRRFERKRVGLDRSTACERIWPRIWVTSIASNAQECGKRVGNGVVITAGPEDPRGRPALVP